MAIGAVVKAPNALTGRYWGRVVKLGATGVVEAVLHADSERLVGEVSASGGTLRRATSQYVNEAVLTTGVPLPSEWLADCWDDPRLRGDLDDLDDENTMRAALILVQVYGDRAVDAFWKSGRLHDDEEVRAHVTGVLAANGCMAPIASFLALTKHAFDALLIQEAARMDEARKLHEKRTRELEEKP